MKKTNYRTRIKIAQKQRKELVERIRKLEQRNKRLEKQNHENTDINKVLKELIKEYVPKIKKEKIGKVIEKCKCSTSQNKILKGIGFSKSSYYYKNKNKTISNFDFHVGDQIELIWKENRCKIGRWNIFWLLNELRKKND